MRIVDHDDQRLRPRERADQAQDCPAEVLARRALLEPHGDRDSVRDGPRDPQSSRHLVHRASALSLLNDLPQRPVGDALAIRRAAPREHAAPVTRDRDELGGEVGLADARLAENRHQRGRPEVGDAREGRPQALDFVLASDQRAVELTADGRGIGVDVAQQKAAVAQRGGAGAVAYDPPGRTVDPDLAAGASPREPFRRSDGLADHGCRRVGLRRGHDLTGADAAAHAQAERQVRRPRDELGRRAERALRVVLVRDRRAEDQEDGVVAQFGGAALVQGTGCAGGVVIALQHGAQRFRVEIRFCAGIGEQREHARHAAPRIDRERLRRRGRRCRYLLTQDGGLERPQIG